MHFTSDYFKLFLNDLPLLLYSVSESQPSHEAAAWNSESVVLLMLKNVCVACLWALVAALHASPSDKVKWSEFCAYLGCIAACSFKYLLVTALA